MGRLSALAVIVSLFIWIVRSTRISQIRFVNGRVTDVSGELAAGVVSSLEDIARDARLTGTVAVYPGAHLRFSRSIGEADRQRIRNVVAAGSSTGV